MPSRHPHVEQFEARQAEARRKARRRRLVRVALVAPILAAAALLVVWLAWAQPFGQAAPARSGPGSAPASSVSAPGAASSVSIAPAPSGPQPPPPSPYDEAGPPPLFNAENPIPDDYVLDLSTFAAAGLEISLQRRAATAFQALNAAAQADGIYLVPLSAYRTGSTQSNNFNASIQNYLAQGYSYQQAEALTRQYYALPGTSEHEAGLAIDLGDAAAPAANLNESFEGTAAYTWLQEHARQYGFIQRYRLATAEITGVTNEPWHYRYVGANHAWLIENSEVALEDYLQPEAASSGPSSGALLAGGTAVLDDTSGT